MSQPTYAASAAEGGGHLKAMLRSTIGAHPVTAGAVIGVLVLGVLILSYFVSYYKSKCKGNFGVARVNNLTTGNNNPLWWLGSGDAGWGGSLHREATPWHVAEYTPRLRAGCDAPCRHPHAREGYAPGPAPGGPPPAPDYPGGPDMSTCRTLWDPAADAEAQALATAGGITPSTFGERRLGAAVNAAFDTSGGLSDAQLQQAMHTGGAP